MNTKPNLPALIVSSAHSPTVQDLLSNFLSGKSEKTLKAYAADLEDFRRFANVASVEQAANVILSNGHGSANLLALSYKNHLIQRNLSPNTVNRRLAALRSFVQLARVFGLVPWGLEVVNLKSAILRDTRGPGLEPFRQMLNSVTGTSPKAFRDRAILRLLFDLGLRSGEVHQLDLEDVDLSRSTLAVLGKGKLQKDNLTLPVPTKEALTNWINVRGTESGALFLNFDKVRGQKRLSQEGLYWTVRLLGEKIGIKTRPHGIRHLGITEVCKIAAKHGIGLEEVLDYSRHSKKSVSILLVYRDKTMDRQGELATALAQTVI